MSTIPQILQAKTCTIPQMFRSKIFTERKIGRSEIYSERKICLISLCWMTSNLMNDVLNPNAISGNGRRWDVGIIFRRNGQSNYNIR